jgi:hypothetical protein
MGKPEGVDNAFLVTDYCSEDPDDLVLNVVDGNFLGSVNCDEVEKRTVTLQRGAYKLKNFECSLRDLITGEYLLVQQHEKAASPIYDSKFVDIVSEKTKQVLVFFGLQQNELIALISGISTFAVLMTGACISACCCRKRCKEFCQDRLWSCLLSSRNNESQPTIKRSEPGASRSSSPSRRPFIQRTSRGPKSQGREMATFQISRE